MKNRELNAITCESYYEMLWDSENMDQWVLGDVVINSTDTVLYHDSPEVIGCTSDPISIGTQILEGGKRMDISYNYGAWIVSARVASVLKCECASDIRLFPCLINGQDKDYFAMFVTTSIDCLDRKHSEIEYYGKQDVKDAESDEERNEIAAKIGEIKSLYSFHVLTEKIPRSTNILVVKSVHFPTVISHRIMIFLKSISASGVYFRKCSRSNP
jgi:hypothetical protein